MQMLLNRPHLDRLLRRCLKEDEAGRDITTRSLFSGNLAMQARISAKARGVLCGGPIARRVFTLLDRRVRFRTYRRDGRFLRAGDPIMDVRGPVRAILAGERTALNILQRLSGIATLTRRYVQALPQRGRPGGPLIYDTRKTTPGLRFLEKYAVVCGGGKNHRMGLNDMAMVKDNHLRLLIKSGRMESGRTLRARIPHRVPLAIEAGSIREARWAVKQGAEIVMLDNMAMKTLRRSIRWIRESARRNVQIEITGGVNLHRLARLARLGVDRISVGAITHSAPALDMSLEVMMPKLSRR
jgi:nicotinate-nucleotide pyrophosphorylase (carboxylating)